MGIMDDIRTRLADNNMQMDSETLFEMIAAHDTAGMAEGIRYYNNESDIINRKMFYFDAQGRQIEDDTKENHKLVNNWHKLLVDQKVSYLVGKPMVFAVDNAKAEASEEFSKKIDLLLGEVWDDTVADVATNASNKGLEWLHIYIDKNGHYKYVIIPAEEVIPVYDSDHKQSLGGVLHYYIVSVEGKPRYRAEWWTRETVTVFIENNSGGFELDGGESANPAPHFAQKGTGRGWGKIPFIEFPNNSMRAGDLSVTKTLIDEYDRGISDFANNVAEIQELVTILRGYEGTNLAEFRHNLRHFKTIKVRPGNDSGVDKLEFNIPVEAKAALLDRLEDNIFMFGQGVNTKSDNFGNSPSGISLEFLYTLLDLKASMMERKFRRAVKRMIWFTTQYINMEYNRSYDSQTVSVTFRKNMVQNVSEIVKTLKDSRDMISDETIVALHPMIETPGDEYTKLIAQRKALAESVIDLSKVNIHE
ncbi:MAG: phage portal protein [Defluviitaleaceae bacterium]|nr:phage portal protein [Defluviitaleaceae bacterium]MCL2273428.1 phage portal protein [Defluviitaleaceae bacterium]